MANHHHHPTWVHFDRPRCGGPHSELVPLKHVSWSPLPQRLSEKLVERMARQDFVALSGVDVARELENGRQNGDGGEKMVGDSA